MEVCREEARGAGGDQQVREGATGDEDLGGERVESTEEGEQVSESSQEACVKLEGKGNAQEKVAAKQSSGHFNVEALYVQVDAEVYLQVEADEVMDDDLCVLKVSQSGRMKVEDRVAGLDEVALPKKTKNALRQANNHVASETECLVDVSEIYSQPRLTKCAKSMGLKAGKAYDIKCGYDLRNLKDEREMWRSLKAEDPEFLGVCPPCTPFTLLQELNYFKMEVAKVATMILEGLHHVKIAAKACLWQHQRGKYFLFEHPLTSRAWQEEELQELMLLPGVRVCKTDLCQYGMKVGGGPNRKPTMWITNSPEVAKELQKRCTGDHEHVPLMGGKAHEAEVYPLKLCKAILRGVKKQLSLRVELQLPEEIQEVQPTILAAESLEEMLDAAVEDAGEGSRIQAHPDEAAGEEDAGEGEAAGSEERRRPLEVPQSAVTPEEMQKIRRLHVNLGHPSKESFMRFLTAGRVRREVRKWVRTEFECQTCNSHALPKAPRPAVVPKCYAPGVAMSMDIFYIPDVLQQKSIPVLNMIDLGTNYQMIEMLEDKEPAHIWRAFWSTWGRTFGMPQYLSLDDGREFRGLFTKLCASVGIMTFRAASRAPWQQGRVERHGGLMKDLIEKCRSEWPPSNMNELVVLLRECECAKNRFSNRSGFSPMQRMTGQWPRMPGNLMSDEVLDPALQADNHTDAFQKLLEVRQAAQQAFMKLANQRATSKALAARPRVQQNFKPGDLVYVYRAMRRKKSAQGHVRARGSAAQRALWVGPGSVLAIEGSIVWPNMMGELWKAAAEQVRLATLDEALGAEVIGEHFDEMKERLNEERLSSRRLPRCFRRRSARAGRS